MPTDQQNRATIDNAFWASDTGKAVLNQVEKARHDERKGVEVPPLEGYEESIQHPDVQADVKTEKRIELTGEDDFLPYKADIESNYDLREQAFQDQRTGVQRPPGEVSNEYAKPNKITVRGIELTSGERVLDRGDFSNKEAASYYHQGVQQLRSATFNINEGYGPEGFKGLVNIAQGIQAEGLDKSEYLRALDRLAVPRSQATQAWNAATANNAHKAVTEALDAPYEEGELGEPPVLPDLDRHEVPMVEGWESAAKMVYAMDNGQEFQGSEQDLLDWYIDEMSNFNWKVANIPGVDSSSMGAYVVRAMNNGPDYAKALLHLIETYDRVNTDWGIVGQNVAALFSDPTTYFGLGGGAVAVRLAAQAAKQRMKSALMHTIVSAGGAGALEGGVYAGLDEAGRQKVAIEAEEQDAFKWKPEVAFDEEGNLTKLETGILGAAGIGVTAGAALGPAAAVGLPAGFRMGQRAGRHMINNWKRAPTPGKFRRQLGAIGDIEKLRPLVNASTLRNSFDLANAGRFSNNRDLKVALQEMTKAASERAGINLAEDTPEANAALAEMVYDDAITALASNANAVGWYDHTVGAALEVLSLIHPEIKTDPQARFAYTYALAVTSNGLKVDKNFELAEAAYRFYKENGRMPDHVGIGTAASAINDSLVDFNRLVDEIGMDNLMKVMDGKWTVRQLERMGLEVGGEHKDTVVRGAAILGPKIGNGFFSNLNGHFDALTMDRWLMRTWGRLTGTLIVDRPDMVGAKTEELTSLVPKLSDEEKSNWANMGVDFSAEPGTIARQIQRASTAPENRVIMNESTTGDQLRRVGNALDKYIDGQKEAPEVVDRNRIRGVFNKVLGRLQEQYPDLTMADLQAVLWYPEKRLYDKAKSAGDVAEGYADDEAPDYANAAINLALDNGLDRKTVEEASERGRTAGTRSAKVDEGAQEGEQAGGRGFTARERRDLLRSNIFVDRRPGGRNSGGARGFNRRGASRDSSLPDVTAVHTPQSHFATTLGDSEMTVVPEIHELDMKSTKRNPGRAEASAKRFTDAILASKQANPHGASVYVYTPEEYADMRLFVTPDNNAGFAVKEDGDIVSVFADGGGKAFSLMQLAIDQGGNKLDAFDTVLPKIYNMMGFEEYDRAPWDDQYMPEDWDKEVFKTWNNGEPDVVFMKLGGSE